MHSCLTTDAHGLLLHSIKPSAEAGPGTGEPSGKVTHQPASNSISNLIISFSGQVKRRSEKIDSCLPICLLLGRLENFDRPHLLSNLRSLGHARREAEEKLGMK